ncbi:hypothetical protein ACMHYJ_05230 [Castellaniella hirudinis]|uniref:hypothetical protein n=1 Tax=Castellaniella hirudinis TaxID=1144617 RepID=UPI0039C2C0B3
MKTAMLNAATMLAGLAVGYAMHAEPGPLFIFGLVLVVAAGTCGHAVQEDRS